MAAVGSDTDRLAERFRDACRALPAPGGNGCHAAILGAATKGVFAGLSEREVFEGIRQGVPRGTRRVADAEILTAVRKATADTAPAGTPFARHASIAPGPVAPLAPAIDYARARAAIIARGGGSVDPDGSELFEASPVRLPSEPGIGDAVALFRQLYAAEEYLFVGSRFDTGPGTVRTAAAWATYFESLAEHLEAMTPAERRREEYRIATAYPHWIPNPLTGAPGETKAGKVSLRADSCVKSFRFVVAEFDTVSRPEQVAFFRGLRLPVSALIDTGGKSVHALLRVDMPDAIAWNVRIGAGMFRHLAGLGLDPSCKNPARLSRLPGVARIKDGPDGRPQWPGTRQRLLWFAPDGRIVT